MKEQIKFPLKAARRFFIFQGIFGLLSIYGFLALPASETDRAVWMGLSLFRLSIIFISFALVIFLLIMIFYSSIATLSLEKVWNKMIHVFVNHQLVLASIMASLFIISVGFGSLEILINPSVFPQTIYYKYLYDRIRPMSLWAFVFSSHLLLFLRKQIWIKHPIQGRPQESINKKGTLSMLLIVISWMGMIILWLRYADLGKDFVNFSLINTSIVISSLILLVLPIYLSHDSKS